MGGLLARIALSISMLTLPLLLAEAALRVHGLGVPDRWFVVRGEVVETAAYEPSPRLPLRLNPQSFPLAKPAGGLRVVCFGGSSVYGYPYGPKGTFPNLLRAILEAAQPGRRVEVINAGFTGGDSARALELMRETVPFGADAWVVYSGHNEFLRYDYATEYDTIHGYNPRAQATLPARLDEAAADTLLVRFLRGTAGGQRLERALATLAGRDPRGRSGRLGPAANEAAFSSFQANLEDMAALAREHGVALVLATVAGNTRTFAPFGAVNPPPLPAEQQQRFTAAVAAAKQALDDGDPARATAALEDARAVAADEAEVHFLAGRALLARGDDAGARAELERAVERDPLRHRAVPRINAIVRGVASREKVPLADVEALLSARAPHGIVGDESIVDNVHPTMTGLVAIAREIAATMARAGLLPSPLPQGPVDEELIRATGMDEADRRRAATRLALSAAGSGHRQEASRLFREASSQFAAGDPVRAVEEYYLLALSAFTAGNRDDARRLLDESRRADSARFLELQERFRQFPIERLLER